MTPIKKSLLLALIGLLPVIGFSQTDKPLPNYTTEDESRLISEMTFRSAIPTPPPASDVRTMAEWEEIEYLVITWQPSFPNILRQIVAAAVEETKVIIN